MITLGAYKSVTESTACRLRKSVACVGYHERVANGAVRHLERTVLLLRLEIRFVPFRRRRLP